MTLTDEDLIGYVLDLLDAPERAAVGAHLLTHPADAARADAVRAALAPLAVDRLPDEPPPGLALRTLARVAQHVADTEPRSQPEHATPADVVRAALGTPKRRLGPPSDRPESRAVGGRFRGELLVAASIGLFAVGFVLSAVSRMRYNSDVAACQNNLRAIHQGLTSYSDRNGGQFPQIGGPAYPTADTFVAALAVEEFPNKFRPSCPAEGRSDADNRTGLAQAVRYAYTLGHRSPNGDVLGLRRTDFLDENDCVPISADYPVASAYPGSVQTSPHVRGNNVLYVGGNVRFATTTTVGLNGDDIYCNRHGQVAAGVDRADAVLGRAGDRP
jgi:hypothetical protein